MDRKGLFVLNREPVDIIIDMLAILKELGKIRPGVATYDKATLLPKINAAKTQPKVFNGYLKIINEYITVRISELVSGVSVHRGELDMGRLMKDVKDLANRIELKRLYEELRSAASPSDKGGN